MTWDQSIIFAALLFCSMAATTRDRWLAITVLWMNFGATYALYNVPLAVGVVDIVSVAILLWSRDRRNYVIAALFVVMIVLYRFGAQLGQVVLYDIVNLLALFQYVVLGGGGFGRLYSNIHAFVLRLRGFDTGDPVGRGCDYRRGGASDMASRKKRGVSK